MSSLRFRNHVILNCDWICCEWSISDKKIEGLFLNIIQIT